MVCNQVNFATQLPFVMPSAPVSLQEIDNYIGILLLVYHISVQDPKTTHSKNLTTFCRTISMRTRTQKR